MRHERTGDGGVDAGAGPALGPAALVDPAVLQDPYPLFDRLRREEPVWQVPGLDLYLVSSWDLVAEATARVEEFSNHLESLLVTGDDGAPTLFDFSGSGTAGTTLATADPPAHTAHRAVVFPELVARRMATMDTEVRALAGQMIAAVAGQARVEWMSAVANRLPMTVVSRVLGLPDADAGRLVQWAFDGTELLAGTATFARMAELAASAAAAGEYLGDALAAAADDPGDDVLGAVARGVAEGRLSADEGVATLVILLGAGGESTSSLLGNAVRLLALDPALQDELRDRPELLPAFVEEAVRLETPFKGHYRRARAATELGGVEIPAGATLLLLWAAANRDPAEFERPGEVVLDRPVARHHLGFGRGIHHCVGAPLARMEAVAVLGALLAATRDVELDPDAPAHFVESVFVRRLERLGLRVSWAEPTGRR